MLPSGEKIAIGAFSRHLAGEPVVIVAITCFALSRGHASDKPLNRLVNIISLVVEQKVHFDSDC